MSQLTTIAVAKIPLGEIHIESYGSTVFATMTSIVRRHLSHLR